MGDEKENRVCPQCGHVLGNEEEFFCSECGASIEQEVKSENIDYKICPNCDNHCSADAVFCNKCGAKIEIEYKCPKCGADYTKDDLFCIKCGEKLQEPNAEQPKKFYCGECGTEYTEGDTFCGECGAKLASTESVNVEQPKVVSQNVDTDTKVHNTYTYQNSVQCRFCGSLVNSQAKKCPHCGEWIKRKEPLGCYNILSWTVFLITLFTATAITQNIGLGIVWAVCVVIGLWIYFIPSWVAEIRKHPNAGAIFAVNFLLGETVIGWVIALVWALCGGGDR